ncbi:MAG: glycerol-3-phosphate dehydrogenase/oxidase [Nannocystaceae bacterium]
MRGLSVLVLEAADVAFGTSSRSTRLVHGGVRYLEQGELGLVYEALRERARLYESAPHLVHATRFLFPAYRGDRLGPWKLRLGLTLYDTLNFHRGQPHEYLTPEAARQAEPLLAEAGLRGAVAYEDAVTDDARLTLAIVLDARRHGAEVLTYAPVVAIEATAAPAPARHRVVLGDGTGVAAHAVVVAAGPWTSAALVGERGNDLLTLSKGTHLVVRARDVPVRQPLVVQVPREKRILFVVPWGSRTYLGTTDAAYEGDPGRSGVTADDEREILELVRPVLPTAQLHAGAIVSAWSGVRPLVRADGARSTAEVSRKHRIVERDDGVLAIVGGKLTTYRQMAEEVVDRVVERCSGRGPRTTRARACTTATVPLVPGEPVRGDGVDDDACTGLALELRAARPDRAGDGGTAQGRDRERIVEDLPYRWCEVDHAIAFEGAVHAIDVVRRRLPLVLTDAQQGAAAIVEIATRLVDAAGGSACATSTRSLERWRAEVATETGRTPRSSVERRSARRDEAPGQNSDATHITVRGNHPSGLCAPRAAPPPKMPPTSTPGTSTQPTNHARRPSGLASGSGAAALAAGLPDGGALAAAAGGRLAGTLGLGLDSAMTDARGITAWVGLGLGRGGSRARRAFGREGLVLALEHAPPVVGVDPGHLTVAHRRVAHPARGLPRGVLRIGDVERAEHVRDLVQQRAQVRLAGARHRVHDAVCAVERAGRRGRLGLAGDRAVERPCGHADQHVTAFARVGTQLVEQLIGAQTRGRDRPTSDADEIERDAELLLVHRRRGAGGALHVVDPVLSLGDELVVDQDLDPHVGRQRDLGCEIATHRIDGGRLCGGRGRGRRRGLRRRGLGLGLGLRPAGGRGRGRLHRRGLGRGGRGGDRRLGLCGDLHVEAEHVVLEAEDGAAIAHATVHATAEQTHHHGDRQTEQEHQLADGFESRAVHPRPASIGSVGAEVGHGGPYSRTRWSAARSMLPLAAHAADAAGLGSGFALPAHAPGTIPSAASETLRVGVTTR